jgi:hypothetical protein
MTLVERPAFRQVAGDLVTRWALDAGDLLLPFKLRLSIHHTSLRLHRGATKAASAR